MVCLYGICTVSMQWIFENKPFGFMNQSIASTGRDKPYDQISVPERILTILCPFTVPNWAEKWFHSKYILTVSANPTCFCKHVGIEHRCWCQPWLLGFKSKQSECRQVSLSFCISGCKPLYVLYVNGDSSVMERLKD